MTVARPVLEILRARRAAGGGPPFQDGYKVALVSEGGAMRGVIAGGMVSAIEAEGLANCFDLMIGTSAGAAALAYLRAGQARFGTRIYYEDINNRAFIDRGRPFRGRAVVDIDYLVDTVFRHVKPLDIARLASPGPRLIAIATDIDIGSAAPLEGFGNPDRVYDILRATTRMPVLAAGPVSIDGRRYIDGGAAASLPLAYARRLGATHVLVIMTRPPSSPTVVRPRALSDALIANLFAALYHRNLRIVTRRDAENYRNAYSLLGNGTERVIEGVAYQGIAPEPDAADVSRIERDERVLRQAADHGFDRMHTFLST